MVPPSPRRGHGLKCGNRRGGRSAKKAEKGLRLENWGRGTWLGEVDYYSSTGFPAGRGEGRDCGLFPSSFKLGGVNRNEGGLHRLSGPAWKDADRAAAATERMTCIQG